MEVGRVWNPKDRIFYPFFNVDSFPVLFKVQKKQSVSPNFELFHCKDSLQRTWFWGIHILSTNFRFFVCRFFLSLKGMSTSWHLEHC